MCKKNFVSEEVIFQRITWQEKSTSWNIWRLNANPSCFSLSFAICLETIATSNFFLSFFTEILHRGLLRILRTHSWRHVLLPHNVSDIFYWCCVLTFCQSILPSLLKEVYLLYLFLSAQFYPYYNTKWVRYFLILISYPISKRMIYSYYFVIAYFLPCKYHK